MRENKIYVSSACSKYSRTGVVFLSQSTCNHPRCLISISVGHRKLGNFELKNQYQSLSNCFTNSEIMQFYFLCCEFRHVSSALVTSVTSYIIQKNRNQ